MSVYHERDAFERACQEWRSNKTWFDSVERQRVEGLKKEIAQGSLTALGCFMFFVVVMFGIASPGYGLSVIIVGLIVLGMISRVDEGFRRWRRRKELELRQFQEPFPAYEELPRLRTEKTPMKQSKPKKAQVKTYTSGVLQTILDLKTAAPFKPFFLKWNNVLLSVPDSADFVSDNDNNICIEADLELDDGRRVRLPVPIHEVVSVHRENAEPKKAEVVDEKELWDKLILPRKVKEDILVYCDTLKNYRRYVEQGVPIPKGVLFYGPPGCGKTETARVLSKAAGFSFVSLSSADLKVGYIGQAAVAIQNAFNDARAKAPCIVYIDEIEASCPVREAGQNSVIDREVVAQLLQEMDGIKTTDAAPVFVFAGTNRKDLIDPAILERFTEEVEIALPDLDARI